MIILKFQKYGDVYKIRKDSNDQLMLLMNGVELCAGFVDEGETTFYAYGTTRENQDMKTAAIMMIDLLV